MAQNVEELIRERLAQALQPLRLEVVNESHLHADHAGHEKTGQTHFRATIVSEAFNGKSRIERQRIVYGLLKDEMVREIHALSIKATAADEYNGV